MDIHAISVGHDPGILAVAIAIALFGSWTACSMGMVVTGIESLSRRRLWIAATGMAGGVTVFSTHYLALLARGDMANASFDPIKSGAACLVAIAGFILGSSVKRRSPGIASDVVGGLLSGGAIAMMHYIGMEGLAGMPEMRYVLPLAAGTVVVGIGLVILSSLAASRMRMGRGVAAVLLASAVLVIHFGGMAAMTTSATDAAMRSDPSWYHGDSMLRLVASGIAVLLALGLLRERISEMRLNRDTEEAERIRSIADMSLEAIVAVNRDGRIVDANGRARTMIDVGTDGGLPAIMPDVWTAIAGGETDGEFTVDGRDGPIPIEVHIHQTMHLRRPVTTVVMRDLSERNRAERRIAHLATHDPLTDLPNRTLLLDRLADSLARSRRAEGRPALLYLDLDGFKAVNDTHGHAKGDEVLRQISDILRGACRETDTVARLGGDEFAIVQGGDDQPTAAAALSRRIIESVGRAFAPEVSDITVGVSIGIAVADAGHDADRLMRDADVALYRAKGDGRGTWRFHEPEMDEEIRTRTRLEGDLRRAIPLGQMSLAYQPQFDITTGLVTGFEALARWRHPEFGDVPPGVFIPAAEASGYMLTLGAWLLEEACAEAATWRTDLHVAVNLSPLQLAQKAMPARVAEILSRTGLPPSRLEIEIPEAWLASDPRLVSDRLGRLRALGVRVAVGDFGAGRSLYGVHGMPFDKVKIGRSALGGIADDRRGTAVLRALIDLGRGLDLSVVAEGIETQEHLDILSEQVGLGIQGHLLGRPGPIEGFRHIVDPIEANDGAERTAAA